MTNIDITARHTKQTGPSLDHVVIQNALNMRDRLVEVLDRVAKLEAKLEQIRLDAIPRYVGGLDD